MIIMGLLSVAPLSALRSGIRNGIRYSAKLGRSSLITSRCHGRNVPIVYAGPTASLIRSKYTISYAHGHDYDHKMTTPLLPHTIGQLLDITTEKSPDHEFIVFAEEGQRLTFFQFRKEVDRLSAGLLSLGVSRGDRVGIWGPNTLEWMLTMYASVRIGAILVNLNPAYQARDLEYALRKVGVKTLIAARPFKTQNYYNILMEICPELEMASPGHLKSKRCARWYGAPTMLIDMLHHRDLLTFYLSSLDYIHIGGSHVPMDMVNQLRNTIPLMKEILIGYGMTEMGGMLACCRPGEPDAVRFSTVGRTNPWCEVKITDPLTGEIVAIGEQGELCGRSPTNMTEYWDDESKTRETIDSARWLHSGDLAKMDEDGYISIVGRIKDMINRGGENIFAIHIENHLHTHPKIEDVQLAHYEIPRYVEFVTSFPLTMSNKVQKYKLREEMAMRLKLESIETAQH